MVTYLKNTVLSLFLLFSWGQLQATHISGANIEYECIGGGNYRVTLHIFQDCNDSNVSPSQNLRVVPNCNFNFYAINLPLIGNVEVSQLCSALLGQSECNGGLLQGKRHLTYQGVVNIPSDCSEYRVLWKQNYRTPSVNVDNTSSLVFYVDAKVRPQEGCNDSPQITIQQLPYVCIGQPISYNFGAVDPEGDSLSFAFTSALYSTGGNAFAPVVYEPGYTGVVPIPGCTIDPESGVLNFTAPGIGEYTINILVSQYSSSGVYLGSVTIDVNIVADICPNPPPFLTSDALLNFSGNATLIGPHDIEMCYGENFCADIEFNSTIPLSDIQMTSNIQQILPGATLTFTGGNPSVATVCWEANQFGLDGTVVIIGDDNLCPIPGIVSFSFNVEVKPGVYAGPDRIICQGDFEQLQAVGDSQFTWEVFQGDPIVMGTNFSCNPCSNPIASPAVTTTYIVTGVDSSAECFYKDTLTLTVALDLNTTVLASGCDGDEGAITVEILSGSGDYSVDFEGIISTLNSNLFDSLALAPGSYDLIIFDNVASCSTNITATVGTIAIPVPEAGNGPVGNLCSLTYPLQAASTGGSLQWTATGPGAVSFAPNAQTEDATATVSSSGSYWLILTETLGTCSKKDSVLVNFLGDINASAGPDVSVCGTQVILSASQNYGAGTWLSVPGGATFSGGPSNPNPTVTVPTTGIYTFFWQVSGGNGCVDADDVIVTFKAFPNAIAGVDHVSCLSTDTLAAIAQNGSGTWTWPAGVSVNNAIGPNAVVTLTGSPGIYTLTWTVSNGTCSASDQVTIEFVFITAANAGPDQANVCGFSATLAANGTVGAWSGPLGVVFDSPASPSSSVTVPSAGGYALTWTLGSGVCASSDQVIVLFNPVPVPNAGSDQTVCNDSLVLAAIPSLGSGQWILPAGVQISSLSNPVANLSTSIYGQYTLVWSENNGPSCSATDTVLVEFVEQPISNAGLDEVVCGSSLQLDAQSSAGIGTWTFPANISLDDINAPAAIAGSSSYGTFTLTWTEDNGNGCISSDQVDVTFIQVPQANAGADTSVCSNAITMQVLISVGIGEWTLPAGIAASDLNDPNSMMTASTFGVYQLIWTEDNGNDCTSSDMVEVSFIELPSAEAGIDTTVCGSSYNLAANASLGAGTWSVPAGVIISDINNPAATVSALFAGTFTLTWSEDNGGNCISTDEVTLTFLSSPMADAGPDQNSCGEPLFMNADASVGIGAWMGPGNISFTDPSDPFTSISSSSNGTFTLYWSENNGVCSELDSLTVTFSDPPVADTGTYAPICGLNTPLGATAFTSNDHWIFPVGIIGDVTDPLSDITAAAYGSYTLAWVVLAGQCSDTAFITIEFLVLPIADAGPSGSICGSSTQLSATPAVGIGQWTFPLGVTGNVLIPNPIITSSTFGSFELIWTVTNTQNCSQNETITLNFIESPVPYAGLDFQICGETGSLNASPDFGVGSWIDQSGLTFGDLSDPQSAIQADPGTYEVVWSEVNQLFCAAWDTVIVTFTEQPEATLISSDQSVCGTTASLNASLSTPGSQGYWSGSTSLSFSPNNSANTIATSSQYGTQVIYWLEDNGSCVDSISLTVTFNQMPMANAGLSQSICGLSASLSALSSIGTGTWTGTGVSFSNINNPNATVTSTSFGPQSLTWTEVNGSCSSTDLVVIDFLASPVADAGNDAQFCGTSGNLAAVLSTGSGSWTVPGGVTLSDSSSPNSALNSTTYGSFVLTWTEENGICSTTDQVEVEFIQIPNANAGSNQTLCGLSASLSAQSSIGMGTWTGAGVSFSNVNSPNATVISAAFGPHTITWTELNGICSSSAQIVIDFLQSPIANAGPDIAFCGTSGNLAAVLSTGTGSWTFPAGISVTNIFNPTTALSSSAYGTFTLTWTEGNGVCYTSDQAQVQFVQIPNANAGSDVEECGLIGDLNAMPSVGQGTWTGPTNISFSDASNPATSFNSSIGGNFTVVWTEVNGICSDQESVNLDLIQEPVANAGQDAGQCGNTYTLQAVPSTGTGTWTGSASVVFFPSPNVPGANASVPGPGSYSFAWTEDNGLCSDQDMVNIQFHDFPDTASTAVQCLNANTQYQVLIDIINGDPSSYEVNGDPGNLTGSTFQSQVYDLNDSYSFVISDENNCGSILVNGNAFCTSLSNAGILDLDTLHSCLNESVEASILSIAFLDPNDVQAFYLHDAPAGIGTIFAITSTPVFTFQLGMNLGQVYYISSVVGNDLGNGLPDLADPGTDISVAVPLIFHDSPQVIGLPDIIGYCPGELLELTLDLIGASPFTIQYEIDGILGTAFFNGQGSQDLSIEPGTSLIWIGLEDKHCSIGLNQETQLESYVNPTIQGPSVISFCADEPEDIPLEFTGSGPWQASWYLEGGSIGTIQSDQEQFSFTPSFPGSYVFYGLNDAQCDNPDSVTVTIDILELPFVSAGSDVVLCEGESITLGSSGIPGLSYSWNLASYLDDPSAPEPVASFDEIGNVTLELNFQVLVSDGTCDATDEVSVAVNPLPSNTAIQGPDHVCYGQSIQLTALGGSEYLWNTPANNSVQASIEVSPLNDTEYVVSIISDEGCSVSEAHEVDVLALPEVELLVDGNMGCPPLEVQVMNLIAVPSGSSCFWNLSAGIIQESDCESASLLFNNPGSYQVQLSITDIEGCIGTAFTDTILVQETVASFLLYPDELNMDDQEVQLISTSDDIGQWTWSFEGDSVGQGENFILDLDVSLPGFYEFCLEVLGENGCPDKLCKNIEIKNNVKVWVPNSFTPDGNRLNEGFYAVVDGQEYIKNFSLKIFDRKGSKVFDSKDPNEKWSGLSSRGNDNPQGLYQYLIQMSVYGESYPREYRGTVTLTR